MITQQSVIQDDGRNIKRNLKKKKKKKMMWKILKPPKFMWQNFGRSTKKSNDLVLSYECIYLIGIDSFTRV